MAEFGSSVEPSLSAGRLVPTGGLTVEQLSGILTEFGLPPLHYRVASLGNLDRPEDWPARSGP